MSGTIISRAVLVALNTIRTAQEHALKNGTVLPAVDAHVPAELHSLAKAREARAASAAVAQTPAFTQTERNAGYPVRSLSQTPQPDPALSSLYQEDLDSEAVLALALKAQQQLAVETVPIANAQSIGIASLFRSTRDISLM